MNIGLDIGYSNTKIISGDRRASFPSVVGTPDKARFSLNGTDAIVLEEPDRALIGQEAVAQSRFLRRREDRKFTQSAEWGMLFLAALTEMTKATSANLVVVTGLPVAFYDDKARVQDRLLGNHRVRREDRAAQSFQVEDVRVIPQPFGALLNEALSTTGKIVNTALATGNVGVVDVGGKTTNLLSVRNLSERTRETTSVSVGAWDIVRSLRGWLAKEYPDLELRDHDVARVVQDRCISYYGDEIELGDVIDEILEPMAEQVIAEATQLWNGAAGLKAVLVAGGGALLLGEYVKRHFRHAVVVDEPVFANALGFWKFAQRIGK